jgi:ribosomal protein S27E
VAKPKRARTERRDAERKLGKLAAERERMFVQGEGGSSARPFAVDSVSVIESRARSLPCPRCGGEQMVVDHAAVVVSGRRLRQVRLRCRRCASERFAWFEMALLN